MIRELLSDLGLTAKEAQTYIELLKNDQQTASSLSNRLGYSRSTAQFIAESLVEKNFANKMKINRVINYSAQDPESIISFLNIQKKDYLDNYRQQAEQIKLITPALEQLQEKTKVTRPKIKIFEGLESLNRVYDDILKSKEEVRSMVSYLKAHEDRLKRLLIYERRTRLNIPIRCLFPDSKLARERQKNNKKELRQSFILPPKKYFWTPDVYIYDNKISIINLPQNFGLIIKGKKVADGMKVLFDLAWKGARKESIK